MSKKTHVVPRAPLKLLALAASLAALPAAAQERPWYIGVGQSFTHEDNVFRSSGSKVDDTISSTSVLGGLNWTPGRQRIYLDATAAKNRYSDHDHLNNTSHSVTTGLNWQTVEHLSGSLRYSRRQNLVDYGRVIPIFGAPVDLGIQDKNIETTQVASASARWGFTSALGVQGSVEKRKLDLSLADHRDATYDMASLGVRWGGGGALSFGVAGRVTKGETPRFRPLLPSVLLPDGIPRLSDVVEPDESDRRDIDFTVTWVPSGLSTISGRISLTKEDHTAPSRPDFDGVTGAVTWDYQPTGKTSVRSSLIRDTGSETSFLALTQFGLTGLQSDNNTTNWIAQVAADWEATGKILVNGNFRYVRGTADTVTGGGFSRDTTRFGLGARYLLTRTVTLGCSASHEQASSSGFSANVVGCFGQFVLSP